MLFGAGKEKRCCGNCLHYEASPLRRKGWCRNPLLHEPAARFLVHERELQCANGIKDFWEAVQPAREPSHPISP